MKPAEGAVNKVNDILKVKRCSGCVFLGRNQKQLQWVQIVRVQSELCKLIFCNSLSRPTGKKIAMHVKLRQKLLMQDTSASLLVD